MIIENPYNSLLDRLSFICLYHLEQHCLYNTTHAQAVAEQEQD